MLAYLRRYTYRVAITNNRIVSIEDGKVIFSYCDRSDAIIVKQLPVKAEEFIRRFLLHILPHGFMKIRDYGSLASIFLAKKVPLPIIFGILGHSTPVLPKHT